MWLKFFCIACSFMIYKAKADPASVSIMALSAASSIDSLTQDDKKSFIRDFFSPKGGLVLEKIAFSVEDHLNDDRPVRLHLIVFYDEALETIFLSISAREYFNRYKQIAKDYPNKIKIFEWQIPAEKRNTDKIKVEYESNMMSPAGGFIFVSYDGPGDHRMRIPASEKEIEISLGQNDFKRVTKEDKKKAAMLAGNKDELKDKLDNAVSDVTDQAQELVEDSDEENSKE